MEQVERKENNESNSIKVGQIIFVEISCLGGIAVKEVPIDFSCKKYKRKLTYGGENTRNYIREYIRKEEDTTNDAMYIAVKSLGNGIFEEMTTGERIQFEHPFELNYEEYLSKLPDDEYIPKYEYIQKLNKKIKENIEAPIKTAGCLVYYNVNDQSKKLYSKHSNEERISVMSEIKKRAIIDAKVANEIIASSIKEQSTITFEDGNIVDLLDSEIYEFEQKGTTK